MIRVRFQNGPDAPEIFLDDVEFESEDEAKKRLDSLVHAYGTVPEAIGWLEGTSKPKFGKFKELFASTSELGPVAGETPSSVAPEPVNPSDVPDRETTSPDFVESDDVESVEEVDATAGAEELASENGVDLSEIAGTGQDGRVTKADVEKHLADLDEPV